MIRTPYKRWQRFCQVGLCCILAHSINVHAQTAGGATGDFVAGFVAGLAPWERPANAPSITQFQPDAKWQERALHGIASPATGTGFLKDQGAWYTPFNRPNLKGRYDIRGMHQQTKQGEAK